MGELRTWHTSSASIPPHASRVELGTGICGAKEQRPDAASGIWWGEQLTSALRSLAVTLLGAVVRHSPPGSRSWGQAMLREMDFIATDWTALRWALGSTTAIFKYSIQRGVTASALLKAIGKSVGALTLSVVFCLGVVAASVFTLTHVWPFLFPDLHLARMPWAQWMTVLGMPEMIFVVTAVVLWRKRKILSSGVMVCAVALVTHFLTYVSNHP